MHCLTLIFWYLSSLIHLVPWRQPLSSTVRRLSIPAEQKYKPTDHIPIRASPIQVNSRQRSDTQEAEPAARADAPRVPSHAPRGNK
uniref:Secreted protein n=1 Tax=Romanomermis culicivorax TaxID=13658 RepID=A0A915HUF4_ROMCU